MKALLDKVRGVGIVGCRWSNDKVPSTLGVADAFADAGDGAGRSSLIYSREITLFKC